jgi:hypothetical protein
MPSGYAYDSVKQYLSRIGKKGGSAGKGSPARRLAAIKAAQVRWGKAELTDSGQMKIKCSHCGKTSNVNLGSLLGAKTSEAKRRAALENAQKPPAPGKVRGRPRKHPITTKVKKEIITPPIPAPPMGGTRRKGPHTPTRGGEAEPKPNNPS